MIGLTRFVQNKPAGSEVRIRTEKLLGGRRKMAKHMIKKLRKTFKKTKKKKK